MNDHRFFKVQNPAYKSSDIFRELKIFKSNFVRIF